MMPRKPRYLYVHNKKGLHVEDHPAIPFEALVRNGYASCYGINGVRCGKRYRIPLNREGIASARTASAGEYHRAGHHGRRFENHAGAQGKRVSR